MRFKNTDLDIREIGGRLDVSTVLEGSVRKAGNQLRITAQLIETANGFQLWSERFDRELKDVFAIQDEIAEATARALHGVLTEGEKQALRRIPTVDPQAYDLYLRGRYAFYQKQRQSIDMARQLFERAIELDSDFGLAHSGVADSYSFLYQWFGTTETDLIAADRASLRAIELEPKLPECHASRGLALSIAKRYEEAQIAFERALQLDGEAFDALYLFARMNFARGDLEQAAELFRRAARARSKITSRCVC